MNENSKIRELEERAKPPIEQSHPISTNAGQFRTQISCDMNKKGVKTEHTRNCRVWQKTTEDIGLRGGRVYLELEKCLKYGPEGEKMISYFVYLNTRRAYDVDEISAGWTVNIWWENDKGKIMNFTSKHSSIFPSASDAKEINPMPDENSMLNICVDLNYWNIVRKNSRKRSR